MEAAEERRDRTFKRPRHAGWSIQQIETLGLGDGDVVEDHVMATGAGKSGGLPCLLDAPALRRKHDSSHHRPALRHDRCAVLLNDEMTEQPLRILAATGERPAPGDPIAAMD